MPDESSDTTRARLKDALSALDIRYDEGATAETVELVVMFL
jgi:hypothetical protein